MQLNIDQPLEEKWSDAITFQIEDLLKLTPDRFNVEFVTTYCWNIYIYI